MEKNNGSSSDTGKMVEFTAKEPSGNEDFTGEFLIGSLIGRSSNRRGFHDILTGNRGYHQLNNGDMNGYDMTSNLGI